VRNVDAVLLRLVLVALLALTACGGHGSGGAAGDISSLRGDPMHGRDLVTQFECVRCHTVATVPPLPKEKQCTGCHADINAGAVTVTATPEQLTRWRSKVAELGDVPTLVATRQRLRPEWIRQFLLHPHDLRPSLVQSMPRLPLSEQQAADIAAFLTDGASAPEPAPWLATADAARGRELLDVKGCGLCHRMTGAAPLPGAMLPAGVTVTDMARAVRLAPDLRFTRDRWTPSLLVAWLVDPQRVKADTLMPTMGLTEGEARSLAAYLLMAPLGPPPLVALPDRLPVLARKVTYDEVATRVFRKTCWHCHGEPDFERGDGGPGNSGGFGFKGVGLNLSDYPSTFAGFLDPAGRRTSLFAPAPGPGPQKDTTSHLIAALLARQAEEAGQEPALRGMPLGLPALGAEDVQLVETWVAQGRAR
jgi:cytochrome c2